MKLWHMKSPCALDILVRCNVFRIMPPILYACTVAEMVRAVGLLVRTQVIILYFTCRNRTRSTCAVYMGLLNIACDSLFAILSCLYVLRARLSILGVEAFMIISWDGLLVFFVLHVATTVHSQVLPRQTCGLFTTTNYLDSFPGGELRMNTFINGGELFLTILRNPVGLPCFVRIYADN